MSKTIVDLVVRVLDQGSGNLRKVSKELQGVDRAQSKASRTAGQIKAGFSQMAIAAGSVGAALFAAKKAFDFGKEGAQLIKVRDTFDALTRSVGETSQAVLVDLRNATKGMVADTELMASASRFLSMGLANTGMEASNLARIAVTLGSAMGKDATAAMEEFALLLSNQSIPRLDTFGISAGKVRTRIKELQDANKDMTRETAFMTAVMEEAEISMKRLGDEVPVDDFSKFEANAKNLTDELKIMAAEGLAPVVAGLNELVMVTRHGGEEIEALVKQNIEGAESLEDLTKELGKTVEANRLANTFIGAFASAQDDTRGAVIRTAMALATASVDYDDFIIRMKEAGLSTDELNRLIAIQRKEFTNPHEVEDYTGEIFRLSRVTEEHLLPNIRRAQVHLGEYGMAAQDAAEDTGELTKEQEALRLELEKWEEQQIRNAAASESARRSQQLLDNILLTSIRTQNEYNDALDDAGPALSAYEQKQQDLNQAIEDSRKEIDEYKRELLGLNEPLDMARGQAAFELFQEANAARQELQTYNEELDKLPEFYKTTIEIEADQAKEDANTINEEMDGIARFWQAQLEVEKTDAQIAIDNLNAELDVFNEGRDANGWFAEMDTNAFDIQTSQVAPLQETIDAFVNGSPYTAHMEAEVEDALSDIASTQSAINQLAKVYFIDVQYRTLNAPPPIPGRQHGGPVIGGHPYIVGERGPELFIPSSSGQIVPNQNISHGDVIIQINGGDLNEVRRVVREEVTQAGIEANRRRRVI